MNNQTSAVSDFAAITQLIAAARVRAAQAVNTTLMDLYWQVGQIISQKIASAQWGDGVVAQLAAHLAQTQPGLRGFTRPNLFRMRQFYEAYQGDAKVSALLRQLPWTHNLIVLNQSKRPEEREFYLRMAAQEKWSSRAIGVESSRTARTPSLPGPSPTRPELVADRGKEWR